MCKVFRQSVIMAFVSVCVGIQTCQAVGDSNSHIQPGDMVTVSKRGVKLMARNEAIASLKSGIKLTVIKMAGKWVGVTGTVNGVKRVGWVEIGNLKRVPLSEVEELADDAAGTATRSEVYHFRPKGQPYEYLKRAKIGQSNLEVEGDGDGWNMISARKGSRVVAIGGAIGGIAVVSFTISKPWAENEVLSPDCTQRLNTGSAIVVPDAIGSKNLQVIVNDQVGFTRLAGLRFLNSCTLNIWKDGVVEVDREDVRARTDSGALYCSRKVSLNGNDVIAMTAATPTPVSKHQTEANRRLKGQGTVVDAGLTDEQVEVYDAVKTGDVTRVRALLEGQPKLPHIRNRDGQTPLHIAAAHGHREVVQLLLDKGAEVTSRDYFGGTSLHWAVLRGHKNVAELLVQKGAAINIRDWRGWTPLHYAAWTGDRGLAAMLVVNGGVLNARQSQGMTPLHIAAANSKIGVVRLLLDRGAKTDVKDNRGKTALEQALLHGHKDVAHILNPKERSSD